MEALLLWHESFETSIEKMDEHQKAFFGFVNEAFNLKDSDFEEIAALLHKIEEHNRAHFTYQEELLHKFEYPDHIRHKKRHEELAKMLTDTAALIEAKNPGVREKLVMILTTWVRDHIIEEDRLFCEFLTKRGVK